MKKLKLVLLIGLMALTMGLVGCAGDDGAPGAPGADVDPTVVTDLQNQIAAATEDAQDAQDAVAALSAARHPEELEKPLVSNIVVARDASDTLTVTFDVTEADGTTPFTGIGTLMGSAGSDVRVYFAAIVPAGTVTANTPQTTWSTDFLEMWAETRGGSGATLTEPTPGSYQMVIAAADGFNLIGGADALEATADQKQRVYVRADARDFEGFNRTMGVADFDMPAQGADTGVITDTTRTIVVDSACTACHNDPLQGAAHGGGYQSPQVCVMCHSPIGVDGDVMQEAEAWSASLFHKIHAAITMDAFPTRINGNGYEDVKYPKDIKDCEVCHFDDGQDMADAWKTNPTIEACTSCHEDTTFVDGTATHTGGAQASNASCTFCHSASTIAGYHEIVDPATYFTTITLEADANADGIYEAGETPLITVTVADVNGDPVSTYDRAEFTNANLYVYGPRANPVPVLTTGSTTDPVNPGVTQSHSLQLFDASNVANPDAQVVTDAGGFKYELLPIPADLAPGTYMIQAYVTHPPLTPADQWYRTTTGKFGWQLITFQIGTATPELKTAGDGCLNCHTANSWGSMFHRGYFATDGCIACHDKSGGYADYLSNRVHAIHSENPYGDLHGPVAEWADITYPQSVTYCTACHSSGDTGYRTNQFKETCLGCHGEVTGGVEAHMDTNTSAAGVGACITCHGAGKSVSIFE